MRHVIFDFDGTIADSEQVALEIMNVLADRHGFRHLTAPEVDRLRRMPLRERFSDLGLPIRKLPGWAKEYNELFQDAVSRVLPIAGMPDLLSQLHELGYSLSILSSNDEENIRMFLGHHHLDFVQDVRCSHRVFSKHRMLKRLLRQNRLRREDVIYVGDEQRDVIACKRAGVKVIWVRWGFDGHEAVAADEPDYVADAPSDILGFVGAGLEFAR